MLRISVEMNCNILAFCWSIHAFELEPILVSGFGFMFNFLRFRPLNKLSVCYYVVRFKKCIFKPKPNFGPVW
jgi:hypothetical protein